MSTKPSKKAGPVFAADATQLKWAVQEHPKELIVIGGQLVLASVGDTKLVDGHVPQPARRLGASLNLKGVKQKQLSVWLQKDAHMLLSKKPARVVFAVDALLRYGQKHKKVDDLLVIMASSGDEKSAAQALRFKKGQLESVHDFVLPASSSHTFDADLHVLLERLQLQFLSASFHWCGPLPPPRTQTFTMVPDTVWTTAPVQRLSAGKSQLFFQQHGLALFIAAAGVVGYCGSIYQPYMSYTAAHGKLMEDTKKFQGQSAFAAERLTLLRSQNGYLETIKQNQTRFSRFETVMNAVGTVSGARLVEAKLYWTMSDEQRKALNLPGRVDFELRLELPRDSEHTALEQSIPILTDLSGRLGMSLRLAPGEQLETGDSTTKPAKNAKRNYRIFGEFPNV